MAGIINPNWSRWIFASLIDHFSSMKQNTNFFVEGEDRDPKISDFAELRLDGPYFNELNVDFWTIDINVAIIIQTVRNDEDIFKLQRFIGIYVQPFTTDIPIYKYGEGSDDDQSLLGCLKLATNPGEKIRVDVFNQIKAATPVGQASIEAHYNMSLIV